MFNWNLLWKVVLAFRPFIKSTVLFILLWIWDLLTLHTYTPPHNLAHISFYLDSTGCGEKIFTLLLYTLFRVVCMSLRRVIWRSNGNFVGFPRIILKIDKNDPRKYNLHFSGERKIWPTRNWNLTINFVAIWGQCALKCLILVYSHSNIILE